MKTDVLTIRIEANTIEPQFKYSGNLFLGEKSFTWQMHFPLIGSKNTTFTDWDIMGAVDSFVGPEKIDVSKKVNEGALTLEDYFQVLNTIVEVILMLEKRKIPSVEILVDTEIAHEQRIHALTHLYHLFT